MCIASVPLVALAVCTGCAEGATFGANLARPANAGFGCESLPTADAFGARIFLPKNAPSCTYVGLGSRFGSSEVAATPFSGTVTRVRLRVGPRSGPMQLTVVRSLRTGVGASCCFYVRSSRVFTPRPNAINRIRTNLRVRHSFSAAAGESVDYLGITVLAPGVPIPANDTLAAGDTAGPLSFGFFPRIAPGDERADGAGISGVTPLLNATVRRR